MYLEMCSPYLHVGEHELEAGGMEGAIHWDFISVPIKVDGQGGEADIK